jgi:hypothetical protein
MKLLVASVDLPHGYAGSQWPKKTSMHVEFRDEDCGFVLPPKVMRWLVNDRREVRFEGYLWRYDPNDQRLHLRIDPVVLVASGTLAKLLAPAAQNVVDAP